MAHIRIFLQIDVTLQPAIIVISGQTYENIKTGLRNAVIAAYQALPQETKDQIADKRITVNVNTDEVS